MAESAVEGKEVKASAAPRKPGRPKKTPEVKSIPVVKNLMRTPYTIAGVTLMPGQSAEVPKLKADKLFIKRLIAQECIEVS